MTDEAALLAAVLADPADDTPRLIYADCLDESGDPAKAARAEFIRLQVEASHLPPRGHVYGDGCDCRGCRIERRTALLFDTWVHHWQAHISFPFPIGWHVERFDRGFLSVAVVTGDPIAMPFAKMPLAAGRMFACQPLRYASFLVRPPGEVYPQVVRVRREARGSFAVIKAEMPRPARGSFALFLSETTASRTVSPGGNIPRAVGGAVRQVLAGRRREMDGVIDRALREAGRSGTDRTIPLADEPGGGLYR